MEIKNVEYNDYSQYLIITVNNLNKPINANISIVGYINNNVDTKVEMINYTIPSYNIVFIRKKMVFNEKGPHIIFVTIKTNNRTYIFYKKLNITYAYNSKVKPIEEEVKKKIEIEGMNFKIGPYPYPPFYDFVYITIRNNDYIPHYVNISFSASLQGVYYKIKGNSIIKSHPPSNPPAITSWTPDVYVPPKSEVTIPIKINFYYSGNYTIYVKATANTGYSTEKTLKSGQVILKSLYSDEIKVYNVKISCPLYIYNITCEGGYKNYAYSDWFDIHINNTVNYDVYGTLQVFLCKRGGDNYKILSNYTLNKYFLAKGFANGYSLPIKLNTSNINPYDENFTVFVLCKTGHMQSFYFKTFSKPLKINGIKVKTYQDHYYFIDQNLFYNLYVNITNNLNRKVYANISIIDFHNRSYSKIVELNKSINIIKFSGLVFNAKNLSHDGNIKLNFTVLGITPAYKKYYTIKKKFSKKLSFIPTPPVYVCSDLNSELFVGYPQNLSFSLKKVVGRVVGARVYITVPKEIKDYAYFGEKYLKIGTMKEIPVNIGALFLKEYDGPIFIHVATNMGVRECVVTRIIHVKPILSCKDIYLHNYTVFIKIRNRTQGFVKNEPIVGYPVKVTVSLKSAVPDLKNIEIWASAMDENGNLINCSKKKTINIYGNYKNVNLKVEFNKSLEGYLIIYAKTGKAIIPLKYKPIMVTYPIVFGLEYDPSDPLANLTLFHNYQVPINVNATVGKRSKIITIYPYKETKVSFYVGKYKNNITVSIELLDNISTIRKFKKTFYFKKLNESENKINISIINITNAENKTKAHNQSIKWKKLNESENNTLPPNIKTETNGNYRYNVSKKELGLFYNVTGLTAFKEFLINNIKNLIILFIVGLIITMAGLLMYEPTRLKLISLMANILHKLKIKEKAVKKEKSDIHLLQPPKIFLPEIIYPLGSTVKIEILSDSYLDGCLYVLSPKNRKYKIEITKKVGNRYIGVFNIPKDESTGQYFIIYEPENLPVGGFLVVDVKNM